VDDAIARFGAAREAVEIIERAALHFGARVSDRFRRRVGSSEAEDFVAGGDQVSSDGRTDPTGSPSDEDTHGLLLVS
jgi:hypothetical protein